MEKKVGEEGMVDSQQARTGSSVSYGFKSPYTTLYSSPSIPTLQGKQLTTGLFSPLMPGAIDSAVPVATSMSVIGKNAQFTLDITRDINNTINNATSDIATLPGASIDDTPSSDLHPLQVAEQMLVQYQKDNITNPQLAQLSRQQAMMRLESDNSNLNNLINPTSTISNTIPPIQSGSMGTNLPGTNAEFSAFSNNGTQLGSVGGNNLASNSGTGLGFGVGSVGMTAGGMQNGMQLMPQGQLGQQSGFGVMGINNGVVGSTLNQVPTLVSSTSAQRGFEPNHMCAFRAIFFNVEGSDSAISVATEEDEEVNKIREQLIMQQKNQLQQQQQQVFLLQQQQMQMGTGFGGSIGNGFGTGLGGLGTTGTLGLGGFGNNTFGSTLGNSGFGINQGLGFGGVQMGTSQPMGLAMNVGANNSALVEQINLINQLSQLDSIKAANTMPPPGEVPFPFDESSWLAALSSLKKYNKARASDPNYVPLIPIMLRGADEIKARATKLLALTNLVKDYTNFILLSLQTEEKDEDDCDALRQSVQGLRRRLISLMGKLSAGSGGLCANGGIVGKWADLNKRLTVKLHNIDDTVSELQMQADESIRELGKETSQHRKEILDYDEKHDILEKLQSQSHALLKLAKETSNIISK